MTFRVGVELSKDDMRLLILGLEMATRFALKDGQFSLAKRFLELTSAIHAGGKREAI